MLQKIHANHFGPESNIRMAREVLFWPGMRKAILTLICATTVVLSNELILAGILQLKKLQKKKPEICEDQFVTYHPQV